MIRSCSTSFRQGWRQTVSYASGRMCAVVILAMMQSIVAFHMKPPVRASQRSLIRKDMALHNNPVDKENPDQHFRSFLFPWRRPLLVRPESQPERGFWLLEQPLHFITVEGCTRMAVYALESGSIVALNAVAPTEETLSYFEETFGRPDHMIIPTDAFDHLWYVEGWTKRFPTTTFWGLPRVKLPGARFRQDLTMETFPTEWQGELDISILEANPFVREVFFLHRSTRSLVPVDGLFEFRKTHVPNPVLRAGMTLFGLYDRPFSILRPVLFFRQRCRSAVSKVLEWEFDVIYTTHGECPIYDGKSAIRDSFGFLWDW